MTVNIPGPEEVVITYVVQGVTHKMRLNCDLETDVGVGGDMDEFYFHSKGGTPVQADTAIIDFTDLLADRFEETAVIASADLYSVDPDTLERTFKSTLTIGATGGAAEEARLAGQEVYTFKTVEGGNMRLSLMETSIHEDGIDPYPSGELSIDSIFQYVVSSTSWIKGRDTSFIATPRNWCPGQNEALYRRRYRP